MKIKTKLILWYTLLVSAVLAAVLAFLLTAGSKILFTNAENLLRTSTEDAAEEIELEKGRIELDDDFRLVSKGVQMVVYQKGRLYTGQLPGDFPEDEPIRAGVLRTAGAYLVYDLPVAEDIVLRGCYSTEALTDSRRGILLAAIIAAPLLLLVAAFGGRWITMGAFAPLDLIAQTAANIHNGSDLTARIGLADTGDEVSLLGAAFDGMLDRLEDAFQAEKQFSSDVSHELRTPIAVIQSQCEYALSGVDSASQQKALWEIQGKARDMSALVGRLLELSRAEHSASEIRLTQLNLSERMFIVAEELADAAEEKQISLSVEAEDGIIINGEETLILRLLLNLAGNAIKYTPPGGHVRLCACRRPGAVDLLVRDDGIGIGQEHLDKIFRRFYRVDASRNRSDVAENEGYGLGLSLCKWIADVHHATISVESEPGHGSTFTVRFLV